MEETVDSITLHQLDYISRVMEVFEISDKKVLTPLKPTTTYIPKENFRHCLEFCCIKIEFRVKTCRMPRMHSVLPLANQFSCMS